jgi:hypothetical protein
MRRPRPSEPKVRQRLTSDPTPKMSSFMYSSRQTTSQAASGRKTNNDDSPQSRPRPARIGLYIAQRAGLLVFLIVLVVSAINVLRLSSSAEIKPLDTSTKQNYLQPLGTYAAAADKQLAGSILNHNKITVDTTGLSDYLLQKFPELTNVSITMPLLAHRPIIYVEAAQPALLLNTTSGSFIKH